MLDKFLQRAIMEANQAREETMKKMCIRDRRESASERETKKVSPPERVNTARSSPPL